MLSYLKPHQKMVVQILAYLAQASHELVPPDVLEVIVQAIANNFIWSNNTSEVITCGLNALREICVRCPLCMPESLLQSLIVDYKSHRDKGPMTACRSLLGLYREFDARMLKRKDRGKVASMGMKNKKVKQYGEVEVYDDVIGGDLWVEHEGDDELVSDSQRDMQRLATQAMSSASVDENQLDSEYEFECISENAGDSDQQSEFNENSSQDSEDDEVVPDLVPMAENKLEAEQQREIKPKPKIGTTKILSDTEFAKLRELNQERQLAVATGQKLPMSDSEEEFVDSSRITKFTKTKDNKEARLQSIKEGRRDQKYGSKKGKKDNHSSSTNRVTFTK